MVTTRRGTSTEPDLPLPLSTTTYTGPITRKRSRSASIEPPTAIASNPKPAGRRGSKSGPSGRGSASKNNGATTTTTTTALEKRKNSRVDAMEDIIEESSQGASSVVVRGPIEGGQEEERQPESPKRRRLSEDGEVGQVAQVEIVDAGASKTQPSSVPTPTPAPQPTTAPIPATTAPTLPSPVAPPFASLMHTQFPRSGTRHAVAPTTATSTAVAAGLISTPASDPRRFAMPPAHLRHEYDLAASRPAIGPSPAAVAFPNSVPARSGSEPTPTPVAPPRASSSSGSSFDRRRSARSSVDKVDLGNPDEFDALAAADKAHRVSVEPNAGSMQLSSKGRGDEDEDPMPSDIGSDDEDEAEPMSRKSKNKAPAEQRPSTVRAVNALGESLSNLNRSLSPLTAAQAGPSRAATEPIVAGPSRLDPEADFVDQEMSDQTAQAIEGHLLFDTELARHQDELLEDVPVDEAFYAEIAQRKLDLQNEEKAKRMKEEKEKKAAVELARKTKPFAQKQVDWNAHLNREKARWERRQGPYVEPTRNGRGRLTVGETGTREGSPDEEEYDEEEEIGYAARLMESIKGENYRRIAKEAKKKASASGALAASTSRTRTRTGPSADKDQPRPGDSARKMDTGDPVLDAPLASVTVEYGLSRGSANVMRHRLSMASLVGPIVAEGEVNGRFHRLPSTSEPLAVLDAIRRASVYEGGESRRSVRDTLRDRAIRRNRERNAAADAASQPSGASASSAQAPASTGSARPTSPKRSADDLGQGSSSGPRKKSKSDASGPPTSAPQSSTWTAPVASGSGTPAPSSSAADCEPVAALVKRCSFADDPALAKFAKPPSRLSFPATVNTQHPGEFEGFQDGFAGNFAFRITTDSGPAEAPSISDRGPDIADQLVGVPYDGLDLEAEGGPGPEVWGKTRPKRKVPAAVKGLQLITEDGPDSGPLCGGGWKKPPAKPTRASSQEPLATDLIRQNKEVPVANLWPEIEASTKKRKLNHVHPAEDVNSEFWQRFDSRNTVGTGGGVEKGNAIVQAYDALVEQVKLHTSLDVNKLEDPQSAEWEFLQEGKRLMESMAPGDPNLRDRQQKCLTMAWADYLGKTLFVQMKRDLEGKRERLDGPRVKRPRTGAKRTSLIGNEDAAEAAGPSGSPAPPAGDTTDDVDAVPFRRLTASVVGDMRNQIVQGKSPVIQAKHEKVAAMEAAARKRAAEEREAVESGAAASIDGGQAFEDEASDPEDEDEGVVARKASALAGSNMFACLGDESDRGTPRPRRDKGKGRAEPSRLAEHQAARAKEIAAPPSSVFVPRGPMRLPFPDLDAAKEPTALPRSSPPPAREAPAAAQSDKEGWAHSTFAAGAPSVDKSTLGDRIDHDPPTGQPIGPQLAQIPRRTGLVDAPKDLNDDAGAAAAPDAVST